MTEMTTEEIIVKLRMMARYLTVTLPRDTEALKRAADLLETLEQQPAEEPMAWRWGVPKLKAGTFEWRYSLNKTRPDSIPLYSTPQKQPPVIDESAAKRIATALGWEPKREWVSLTDEDWLSLGCKSIEEVRIGLVIEAALRSKNG